MMTGSRPACPRCTLGNDSNVVADKPEEAEGLDKRRVPECPECCTGRDCLTIIERDLKQEIKDSKFPVGHGHYGFESKRAVPRDADADLDGSFRWRRSASEDVDAEGFYKRMRPVCTVKQQENNEC